jgi:hypothetical protein
MKEITNDEIVAKLEECGASRPCARCGNEKFGIVSKTMISIQEDLGTLRIGGQSIPAVIVACNKCGNLNSHALGALGLLKGAEK